MMTTQTRSATSESTMATIKFVVGLAMLIGFFLGMNRIPGWATEYGTLLTYLVVFVFVSVAGRLFWSGADTWIGHLRGTSN